LSDGSAGPALRTRPRRYGRIALEAPAVYLIFSEWGDAEAFKAFIESDRFRRVTDWGPDQLLAARPVHTVYGA